ncbi:MAG: addiction module protein [Symploca sp. SIO2E6]|nr:addiction module protein [Symploca sp. SIO2E6]
MAETTQKILQEALTLSPIERALLIDHLVASLDRPDPKLDKLWIEEAENRLKAYNSGELESVTAELVFQELAEF